MLGTGLGPKGKFPSPSGRNGSGSTVADTVAMNLGVRQRVPETADRGADPELDRIVEEEQACLTRVLGYLALRRSRRPEPASNDYSDYDAQLLDLRDELACARLEDIPPLLEQMDRLQSLAARRREIIEQHIDARSPYFGRLVLEEHGRRREVLIGRGTCVDTHSGVRIVDWRDAPVSRLYYRYEEGDEYDEIFGEREIEGRVITRRSVTVVDGELRRIHCPQGRLVRTANGSWRRLADDAARLGGGQGSAARAEQHHRLGKLGGTDVEFTEDKHLREITALIDPRQFELITREDSGLVVIQGGAGSGKTTIGLHRLAYLAYVDPRRFRPDRMLAVVYNDALARYMSKVLPALEVEGVAIRTYEAWARRLRSLHLPSLPKEPSADTPPVVTRLKKHPAMLRAIDERIDKWERRVAEELERALTPVEGTAAATALRSAWAGSAARPLAHRIHALASAVRAQSEHLPVGVRVVLDRLARDHLRRASDVISSWAELLTDRGELGEVFQRHAQGVLSPVELDRAHAWCVGRCSAVVAGVEEPREESEAGQGSGPSGSTHDPASSSEDEEALSQGIDGRALDEAVGLDREDDSLLLRLIQRQLGPLMRGTKGKEVLVYEHVFVDEAQDLSPVDLAVVLDTASKAQCVTLAGDISQRLHLDNGFTDWRNVLADLGKASVELEPLRISYRSTLPIISFAGSVLGPLNTEPEPQVLRNGAPVELFNFGHSGDAVGFLAEQLRELMHSEPRASVAVIARYPEHADLYYSGLKNGDVPGLRRVSEQDFPFTPGVDVTDVRQVKGLEFDYVILIEATASTYPVDDEARHLLYIAATRAAHQLWVLATGTPSRLLPQELGQNNG